MTAHAHYLTASDLAPAHAWFKAKASGSGNACIMVADLTRTAHHGIGLHDSKNPAGPAMIVPADAFAHFIDGVRDGHLGG
ncbi:DUF397 domain-containing protein [Streptomyces sp. JJ38]|uniref:DUF397 domain-containing protein n=1 Tax=Streptomyces sp. JJ38 TaxID=2738128 RepID=UPI001C56C40D|nr:DUF397 domain-containing protein [Streptomyces sp. JJ38]MBW1597221.1 DUF397 domain-containing protein [Streptomyces sp. JJ38]